MVKSLIVYFSKYGTTKEYAEWIAQELNGDIYSINNFKENTLNNYDTIIIGSGLYAGKVKGIENSNEEVKEFIETYGKVVDFMDKNNIKELIDYCNKI